MPIEIKELLIKVIIEETQHKSVSDKPVLNSTNMANFKKDIVKTCVQEVLEKIKEKQER